MTNEEVGISSEGAATTATECLVCGAAAEFVVPHELHQLDAEQTALGLSLYAGVGVGYTSSNVVGLEVPVCEDHVAAVEGVLRRDAQWTGRVGVFAFLALCASTGLGVLAMGLLGALLGLVVGAVVAGVGAGIGEILRRQWLAYAGLDFRIEKGRDGFRIVHGRPHPLWLKQASGRAVGN